MVSPVEKREKQTNRSTVTYNNVYIKNCFNLSRAAVVRVDVNYELVHLEVTTIINDFKTLTFWVFE